MQNKLTGSWGRLLSSGSQDQGQGPAIWQGGEEPRTGQGEGSGLSDYLMENCACWMEIQSAWPMGHSSLASLGCERWGWTTFIHFFLFIQLDLLCTQHCLLL